MMLEKSRFFKTMTAAAFTVAVMCFAGSAGAQTFFTQDFSSGNPSGWTYDGFSRLTSGGINGAGLRVNLNSSNPTASITIPNVTVGTNALVRYSYKATNYSNGAVAASGAFTYIVSLNPESWNWRSGTYTPPPSGSTYWIGGWNLSNEVTGVGKTISITLTFTWQQGDIYLYLDDIQVVGARYIITFDPNGGNVTRTVDTTQTEARKLDSLPTPTRDRYAFNGWYTSPIGGTQVTVSTAYTASTTLYAQWIPIYRITFDANGGSVSPTTGSTGMGGKLTSLPTPTRSGYTFSGWFTDATGGTQVTTGTEFSVDAVVYAHWAPTSSGTTTYTITYALNGGTVSPANPTSYTAATASFTLNNPTRSGYTFTGWTGANGTTPQTTVTIESGSTGNKSYTANWTAVSATSYTVMFEANGGTLANTTGTTGSGGKLASLPTPTRAGYTFDGWYTEETDGVKITTGTVFSEDAVVYARWTPIRYTITYNLNGGTVEYPNPTSYTVETDGFELNNPTRAAYIFDGWTGANGTVKQTDVYVEQGSTGNKTYTANWTLETYMILFDATGGEVSTESGTTGAGGKLTSLPTPTREEYVFIGWFTEYTDGTRVTTSTVFSGDATIYAQWMLMGEFPMVIFDANGGTVSPTYGIIGADGKLESLPESATRVGYTFGGWFTTATGGTKVTTNTVFKDDATIYARWTPNTYKVTFSAGANGSVKAAVDGGSITSGASVQHDKDIVFTATPNKGYDVDNWTLNGETVNIGDTAYTLTNVSAAATVAVSFIKSISVASPDRVVPNVRPDDGVAVIAPVNPLSAELTAGPNPVGKSSSTVNFFRNGSRVAYATLSIYDASGNVVRKIRVIDDAVGSQSRRKMSSWDLRDTKGRPVSEGTYLVKGVLKTSGGKREKVSVVVGVVR
jgi:uncharacterized repeat protein (TIGR02543 family)